MGSNTMWKLFEETEWPKIRKKVINPNLIMKTGYYCEWLEAKLKTLEADNTKLKEVNTKTKCFMCLLRKQEIEGLEADNKELVECLEKIVPTRDEVLQNKRGKDNGIRLGDLNEIYFSMKDLIDKKINKHKPSDNQSLKINKGDVCVGLDSMHNINSGQNVSVIGTKKHEPSKG